MVMHMPQPWVFAGRLGQGSFSVVARCTNQNTGETKVMKCIDKAVFYRFKARYNSRARIDDELFVLSQLQGPGIVRLHDFSESALHFYLVLEYAGERNLYAHVAEDGPVAENLSRSLCRKMIGVLDFVHQRGFVHRDIKPENWVPASACRCVDMDVILVDWGLAAYMHARDGCFTQCGSMPYMAPEVITVTAARPYGNKADMWSMGVTLYVMLAALPPFADTGLVEAITEAEYEFDDEVWRTISLEAQAFIRRLMLVDRRARMCSSEALRHPWLGTRQEGERAMPN
jgi:serine/threonine protein kinase